MLTCSGPLTSASCSLLRGLSAAAQRLFARLTGRKGALLRLDRIDYAEVSRLAGRHGRTEPRRPCGAGRGGAGRSPPRPADPGRTAVSVQGAGRSRLHGAALEAAIECDQASAHRRHCGALRRALHPRSGAGGLPLAGGARPPQFAVGPIAVLWRQPPGSQRLRIGGLGLDALRRLLRGWEWAPVQEPRRVWTPICGRGCCANWRMGWTITRASPRPWPGRLGSVPPRRPAWRKRPWGRALNRLGRWFERQGELGEALACYSASSIPPAGERRVRTLHKMGNRAAAEAQLRLLRGNPANPQEADFAARFSLVTGRVSGCAQSANVPSLGSSGRLWAAPAHRACGDRLGLDAAAR